MLVIFGATGDLVRRKLIPALYHLFLDGQKVQSLACSRRQQKREHYLKAIEESTAIYSDRYSPTLWRAFAKTINYHRSNENPLPIIPGQVFYFPTPWRITTQLIVELSNLGLLTGSRVLIEKPFGRDLATAEELQTVLSRHLTDGQIGRIDHYLVKGKTILKQRKLIPKLEKIWNRRGIAEIEVLISESIGIEGRGEFFENMGIARDMLQNHVLVLLSLAVMDLEGNPEMQRAKALGNLRLESFKLGQYTAGVSSGKEVLPYRSEGKVDPQSQIATAVYCRAFLDNPRWSGVPIHLITGKRFSEKKVTVKGKLRNPLPGENTSEIVFQIEPPKTASTNQSDPYRQILASALKGGTEGCVSFQEVSEGWRFVSPLLADHVPTLYPAGDSKAFKSW